MAMANLRGGHNLERAEFNGAVGMHLASTLAPPPPSAGNGTSRDFSQNSYDHLYVLITIPITIGRKEAKTKDSTQERSKDATTQDQLNTRRPALTSPMHIARRACILVAQGLERWITGTALTGRRGGATDTRPHFAGTVIPPVIEKVTDAKKLQSAEGHQTLYLSRCSPALTSPVFAARRACTLVAPNGMR